MKRRRGRSQTRGTNQVQRGSKNIAEWMWQQGNGSNYQNRAGLALARDERLEKIKAGQQKNQSLIAVRCGVATE